MLTVSGKRRSMYLCSSDVFPTFMSPKSTIFPSGFLIFPQEDSPRPCAREQPDTSRDSAGTELAPTLDCSDPRLAETRTRRHPDSRGS